MEEDEPKSKQNSRTTGLLLIFVFIAGLLVGLIFHDSLLRQPAPDTDIHRWYPR